jgi:hypothetical protein
MAAPTLAQPQGPVAKLAAPTGWTVDDATADRVAAALGQDDLFAGVPIGVDAQAWRSPTPGAALVSTQLSTETLPADPGAAATLALHALRAGADATTGAAVTRWEVKVDPAGKLHEALLEWRDPSVEITTVARALVFRTGGQLVRIAGECVLGPEAGAMRAACEATLATMAPTATALEPVAVTATPPPSPADPAPGGTALPGAGAPPSLKAHDGEIPATLAVRPPPPQKRGRRPLYLLGGVLVLGAVFWWNRKQRERLAELDRFEAARRERQRGGDGDAPRYEDDGAARKGEGGDKPEDEERRS